MITIILKQQLQILKRNRLFTALNLCGFVFGLTASMILALYVYREYNIDKCFPNHENIYLLVNAKNNRVSIDCDLVEMLKDRFPEVENAAPLNGGNWSGTYLRGISNNEFITNVWFGSVNNDFFRMFSVKTLFGDPNSPFIDPNSAVITASTAQKLFGKLDVVGEPVSVSGWYESVVSAVVGDMPENSGFSKADFFVNSQNKDRRFSTFCNGNNCHNPMSIYVQLGKTANPDNFANAVNRSFPPIKGGVDSIRVVPLSKTYMATDIEGKVTASGSPATNMVFFAITLAIMFLSIFNYLNFSLSKQLTTLKNIGIRIAHGARIAQLRTMFITETSIIVGIACLLALLLTYAALPIVETQLLNVPLRFSDLFSPTLAGISLAVLAVIVLIASLAPIYIISRFDIQSLFGKGAMRLGKQRVRQIFTTIQLAASIALLVSLFTIYKQLGYAQSYDLGFNKEHLLRISLGRGDEGAVYKRHVEQFHFVESSALSGGTPGLINMGLGINEKDDDGEMLKIQLQTITMDENFMQTMGIELIDGREMLVSDKGVSCYINEETFKQAGWKSYEGKKVNNYTREGVDIIGIVRVSTMSIHKQQEPATLMFTDQGYNTLSVRLRLGNLREQLAELEKTWKEIFPATPFQYAFYDDVFDAFYRKETQQAKGIAAFSIIALLITCMGLIGKVFQTCQVRRKEIGIRKIHGASIWDIMALFNMTFVKEVIVAFIIAAPVSYYFMNQWLLNFAYKTSLNWWVFALAGAATLVVTLIVVNWQCWSAARANPVDAIKSE